MTMTAIIEDLEKNKMLRELFQALVSVYGGDFSDFDQLRYRRARRIDENLSYGLSLGYLAHASFSYLGENGTRPVDVIRAVRISFEGDDSDGREEFLADIQNYVIQLNRGREIAGAEDQAYLSEKGTKERDLFETPYLKWIWMMHRFFPDQERVEFRASSDLARHIQRSDEGYYILLQDSGAMAITINQTMNYGAIFAPDLGHAQFWNLEQFRRFVEQYFRAQMLELSCIEFQRY